MVESCDVRERQLQYLRVMLKPGSPCECDVTAAEHFVVYRDPKTPFNSITSCQV